MCLSYIGGKSRIGKWISQYIPSDIETYVEPFGGMYWVFFKMNPDSLINLKTIVYNDFNPLNTNFFKCLSTKHKEILEYMEDVPSQDKDKFYEYQKEIFSDNLVIDEDGDIPIAVKYAYVLTQVWSGTNPDGASFIDLKGKYKSKFDTFRDKLGNPKWTKLFKMITFVENMDFQKVVEKYDSPTTYVYLDPPYWKTEDYYSNHDFDRKDHERVAETLQKMQGKFSLSYYDFDLLHEWFPEDEYKWERKEFAKAAGAKSGKKQSKGEELLIMNY